MLRHILIECQMWLVYKEQVLQGSSGLFQGGDIRRKGIHYRGWLWKMVVVRYLVEHWQFMSRISFDPLSVETGLWSRCCYIYPSFKVVTSKSCYSQLCYTPSALFLGLFVMRVKSAGVIPRPSLVLKLHRNTPGSIQYLYTSSELKCYTVHDGGVQWLPCTRARDWHGW